MKKILLLVALAAISFVRCSSSDANKPGANSDMISLYFDDQLLLEAREAIEDKDPAIMTAYKSFKNHTDTAFLNMEPISITFDKIHTAPSRDPRDYISLSPYWWPNPDTADGSPYLRNDGVTNPEVYEYHERERSGLIGEATQALALMYFFTGEEQYAAKAAELLRAWFTDKTTGMNPNMTYAQYVPGMERIRGTGIIDSRRWIAGFNAAMIIADSESWTSADKQNLQDWANSFRYWMEHSVNGLTEIKTVNNHGLWYETIRLMSILYSGDTEHFKDVITNSQLPRIGVQVEEDGTMPSELARTLGLHYTTFALEALAIADIMAEKVGLDVWSYKAENGRSLSMAIDYALPYMKDQTKWPHQQNKPYSTDSASILLYQAGTSLGNQAYLDASSEIGYKRVVYDEHVAVINDILFYKHKN